MELFTSSLDSTENINKTCITIYLITDDNWIITTKTYSHTLDLH